MRREFYINLPRKQEVILFSDLLLELQDEIKVAEKKHLTTLGSFVLNSIEARNDGYLIFHFRGREAL